MQKQKILLLSVFSGLLLSLPWLVSGQSWTLFFAFCPLLFAEDQICKQKDARLSQVFLPAFIAFLIWNLLSTWWIAYVSVAGMFMIAALNSILMASVWWGRQLVNRKFGEVSASFSLVVFWIGFEFLMHNQSIPWPWLTLGNGFANSVKIIQWYEYTGVLGGSFWVLLTNLLIWSVIKTYRNSGFSIDTLKRTIGLILLVFVPVLGSLYLYSNYSEKGNSQDVIIVQPNIDPYTEKFAISPDLQINKIKKIGRAHV